MSASKGAVRRVHRSPPLARPPRKVLPQDRGRADGSETVVGRRAPARQNFRWGMANTVEGRRSDQDFLPDFCTARVIFTTVLLAELLAIALSLHSAGSMAAWLPELAMTSLFMQWIVLGSAALLCLARGILLRHPALGAVQVGLLAWCVVLLVTALVTELSWFLAPLLWGQPPWRASFLDSGHLYFFLHAMGAAGIITAIYLRYLYVNWQWRRHIETAAQSQFRALQSRIRPHFLFNCLNSIAAMIAPRPDDAEQAVEDLAELIRASLEGGHNISRFEDELILCRKYLRIEANRLGRRLRLRWETKAIPDHAHIPQLLLQPLLENAVYHGIEMLEEGGVVHVKGERLGAGYRVQISNPRADRVRPAGAGHSLGMNNIQRRLEAIYGPEARLEQHESGQLHVVTVSIPVLTLDDETLQGLITTTTWPKGPRAAQSGAGRPSGSSAGDAADEDPDRG